jgi:hypothetical protein
LVELSPTQIVYTLTRPVPRTIRRPQSKNASGVSHAQSMTRIETSPDHIESVLAPVLSVTFNTAQRALRQGNQEIEEI